MEEQWKPIPGFSGYEVSDLGRARSWLKSGYGNHGQMSAIPHLLNLNLDVSGRAYIAPVIDRIPCHLYIHRAVLLAFVGPCPNGMVGCHNDDDHTNNCLNNLRWDTVEANIRDQMKHGLMARGESLPHTKLSAKQVLDIRTRYADGETTDSLMAKFTVSRGSVNDIVRGKNWKYVGGPITFRQPWNKKSNNHR